MISSLLVANRGEITRRIFRTARRMGIRTIAVYSQADAHALHVREADEAVLIGPAPARESYLLPERILEAARQTGAEAIHPGYGFLSENAAFARAVIEAGLVWVGPPANAIEAMGLKDAAKQRMAEAGVPVTPGYLGADQSADRLKREADAIGYPVLIKAVAGGGGKGMRKVLQASDFADALASCQREAAASFGDDRVLLETYVSRPRHIEVQVFGDRHGNVVHLFERDCSLQRRHQKVIEEAPAPGMDQATRAAICEAAVKAARAVAYEGAGTVEFIADASDGLKADRIWFMEMNTRLQVEHPVTEMITGQDLVEWQLRVASGEYLPLRQDQLQINGWAMEARLYAENPATGFLPSTGRLEHFHLPEALARIDSAVEAGGEVTPFYDPMIAKIIVHGPDRQSAARKLAAACRDTRVWPVRTNAGFLARCAEQPDFLAGDVDTGFIEARSEALLNRRPLSQAVIQAAYEALDETLDPAPSPWSRQTGPLGFRLNAPAMAAARVTVDGEPVEFALSNPRSAANLMILKQDGSVVAFENGDACEVALTSASSGAAAGASDGAILSPMPGRVVSVSTRIGDSVTRGQTLLVLEAMKMEHAMTAPFDGVVAELSAVAGGQVSEGIVLVRLEPA